MRVIDANTGHEVRIGETFRNADGAHTVLAVEPGLLSARAQMRSVLAANRGLQAAPVVRWVPLVVRWTHPSFFGRHVAFIES